MKRQRLGISAFCFVLVVIVVVTNEMFVKAVRKQPERIEVTYLLGEWVDCSQPLDKNFISIQIYYKDGSIIQKQGVGTIYPYTLTPGKLNKVQVEYEGMIGEFCVWGKEENVPMTVTTGSSIKTPVSTAPSPTSVTPTPIIIKDGYELVSCQKGIVITGKAVKKYNIYENNNLTFTLGTSNIKKIEYQFVKKGKKKSPKWKTMKNNQVVLKKQGCYVLYLRFTTMTEKKIIKHTNGFVLDKTAPVILGVKNKKIYPKRVTVNYKDALSGIKKATINGKTLKKNTTIKKNGNYHVEITDKAKNKRSLKFTINIPTPTPKPTIPPTTAPLPEPVQPSYIPVTRVAVASSLSIEKGKKKWISYQVFPSNATNQKVTFTSTNKNIVTVGKDGTIKGKAAGVASVVIRSQSDSTKYATCVVYVR
ncbi:MAG: hypothetical protein HFJ09_01155 [Lachnospiraceae bacterium]|nr:hypothetical protein [Lachnospiraceae bacterium]